MYLVSYITKIKFESIYNYSVKGMSKICSFFQKIFFKTNNESKTNDNINTSVQINDILNTKENNQTKTENIEQENLKCITEKLEKNLKQQSNNINNINTKIEHIIQKSNRNEIENKIFLFENSLTEITNKTNFQVLLIFLCCLIFILIVIINICYISDKKIKR